MEKRLIGFIYEASCYYLSWWFSSKEVCYNNITDYPYEFGCFDNKKPFCNANQKLPELPFETIKLKFKLYTTSNTDSEQLIDMSKDNSVTVTGSNFDGTKKTVLIIHGFRGSSSDAWVVSMRQTLLRNHDINVIAVDWAEGADNLLEYYQAAANTRIVGAVTGHLIMLLNKLTQISYDKFHIIGHSLGAHTAGYAAKTVFEKTNAKIGRITGLDPASPAFEKQETAVRLDFTDADFVDVIHTDTTWFGIKESIGHADFYPNFGYEQPGCPVVTEIVLSAFTDLEDAADGVGCNHLRAIYLFISSISCATFTGNPCNSLEDAKSSLCNTCGSSCNDLGYASSPVTNRQMYYLMTDDVEPFCYRNNLRRFFSLLKRYMQKRKQTVNDQEI